MIEEENTLSWGFDPRRSQYVFPLHNLRYEPELTTVETKRQRAKEPEVEFRPQARTTREMSKFSKTGNLAVEIDHYDLFEIDDAARLMLVFIQGKDEKLAAVWTKTRLREFIVKKLKAAGQDETFLSKENLLRLQQAFGPMFRDVDRENPRMSQVAKEITAMWTSQLP